MPGMHFGHAGTKVNMNTSAQEKIPFFRDPAKLAILYQILTLAGVGLLSYYLVHNTLVNLERQSISTGFGFLHREASFEIGEALLPYSAADSYGRALAVGFFNTLLVSFIGVTLTVILGTFLGIARLSSNWLVAKLSAIYIELFQDIPILLQLFFWYAFFYEILPSPRQALNPIAGIFLCNRGLIFGVPEWHAAYKFAFFAFIIGCVIVYFLRKWAAKRQAATGQIFPLIKVSLAMLIGLPLVTWWLTGAPTAMNVPKLSGFNFKGGVSVSPEFTALLLGLVLYTAAFVAEVVRAGIQSVTKGQTEAAMSIGLKTGPGTESGYPAPGTAGYRTTADQPDAQPDKKQFTGSGHRLPGFCIRCRNHHQPDRPGHRRRSHDHDGLSDFQPVNISIHELVQ